MERTLLFIPSRHTSVELQSEKSGGVSPPQFANFSKISVFGYIPLVRLDLAFRRRFIYCYSFFLTFNSLKRFRVAFSFMCDGKDVFVHFLAA